ncbi:molybdopterin-dependent oxidoreductase [Adlercreutzia sp. R7]|uniref:Molybdopterin-dependent oxidoreductase n=1 Tax=Adlercreutzia wanghongyangiae TaxID=3111451 RepID=A0ABU6IK21_9ACTN|nr:molybdopterin-dependent oxidoreductase [Adlercreutzia sp. R7]
MSRAVEKSDRFELGRRAFLQGSAATLGIAALGSAGCAPREEIESLPDTSEPVDEEDEIFQGVCRGNCGGGCRMNVHVRGGKIVKTSKIDADDELDTRICQKGLSHAQRVYAPERVQYPLRRVDGTPRGGGEWERISWDEAIEEIATKWQDYIAEYGGTSIGVARGGAGTYSYNQYIYTRLANMIGAVTIETGYDMAGLEMADAMTASFTAPYLAGNDVQDVLNSKNIFTWARNSTVAGLPNQSYINTAVANGTKRIVIDPVYTPTAAHADLWIPIRPATDGALALAMTNYIIANGLADDEYLRDCTVAPLLVKESDGKYLRMSELGVEPEEGPINPMTGQPTVIDPPAVMSSDGQTAVAVNTIADPLIRGSFDIDGIKVNTAYEMLVARVSEWSLERAASVCDVPAEKIAELANLYVDGPSLIEIGFGNDHWGNGASVTHCQLTLAMVAGQYGLAGGGIGGVQGNSTNGIPGANFLGMYYPEGAPFTGISTSLADFHQIVDEGKYGDREVVVKSLLVTTGNPVACSPDRERIKKTFDALDLVICVDWLMTDTANYSDIVLPAAHWFEIETINACPTPYADFQEMCIPPQCECKSDIDIAALLGVALGYKDAMDLDTEAFHKIALDSDLCREAGLTWESIKEQKHLRHAPEAYVYGNRENPFLTATGRGQFYIEDVKPRFDHGQSLDAATLALPSFQLPDEAWAEGCDEFPKYELANKYPLTLMSQRDKFKVHTTFAPHPWFLELQPEPTLRISPVDAELRGIKEDDYVRVRNDRGACKLKAHMDAGLRPGIVLTEHTWADNQYLDGNYTALTSCVTEQFKPAPHPFDTLVEVELW